MQIKKKHYKIGVGICFIAILGIGWWMSIGYKHRYAEFRPSQEKLYAMDANQIRRIIVKYEKLPEIQKKEVRSSVNRLRKRLYDLTQDERQERLSEQKKQDGETLYPTQY